MQNQMSMGDSDSATIDRLAKQQQQLRDRYADSQELVGELKLTLAKFYRVSGQSTQHRGVVPDIHYPSLLQTTDIGESSLPGALPWDTIPPARYNADGHLAPFIKQLADRHELRAAIDPEFSYTLARLDLNRTIEERKYLPLNETKRREQQEAFDKSLLLLENKRREARGEKPLTELESDDPLNEISPAMAGVDEDKLEDDPFLAETGKILIDLLELQHQLARAG